MTQTPEWQGRPEAPASGEQPYPYSYPPAPPGPYAGGYPTGPYAGPPPPMSYGNYPVAPVLRNGLGVTALVVAIFALLLSITVAGGVILGIAAVVIGFFGRARIRRSEADNPGVTLTGIILGVLAIIIGLLFVPLFWVPVFNQVGASDYVDCLQQAGQDPVREQECSDELRQSLETHFTETRTPGR